jgi:epoxyqueuosine reductase
MHDANPRETIEILARRLPQLAQELGFCAMGIARPEVLPEQKATLESWLAKGCHGQMDYMERHAALRLAPDALFAGTKSIVSLALPYGKPADAPVSRYAQGRDYHKTMRMRLKALALAMQGIAGEFPFRAFSDSAPVLEVAFAGQAGLGWRGKNTLLLTRQGSGFFLGELFTALPLPPSRLQAFAPLPPLPQTSQQAKGKAASQASGHCGSCRKCLDLCPTQAFTRPYELDARRCISYLTIEHPGPIPEGLRALVGQRFYGCDVCQAVCPWNRFAAEAGDAAFAPWPELRHPDLPALFLWDEAGFLKRLEGSPIRRIGHERWLRNLAVALGNSPPSEAAKCALAARREDPSPLVREHVAWALQRQAMAGEAKLL